MVDVVGADIYEPSGSTMDGTWEEFKAQFEGKKLVTLSETGGIIVPGMFSKHQMFHRMFQTHIFKVSNAPSHLPDAFSKHRMFR